MCKKETKVTIINKLGLHARASAVLVRLASQFKSEILLCANQQEANAKSILGVMALAAGPGSDLSIIAEGEDAELAIDELVTLIKDRFGESE